MILIVLVTIAFSVLYSEWIWSQIKNGYRSYDSANRILKTVISVNFILAIAIHAWGCLIYAIISALYQMVIFKERKRNLDGPVA